MELIIKSDNEHTIERIIAFAQKLNVVIEKYDEGVLESDSDEIRRRIMNFKADTPPSIKDPVQWQREQREDRDLFPKQ